MTPVPATHAAEKVTLERCAQACLAKLCRERERGDDLNAALTEADLNGILEQLLEVYKQDE